MIDLPIQVALRTVRSGSTYIAAPIAAWIALIASGCVSQEERLKGMEEANKRLAAAHREKMDRIKKAYDSTLPYILPAHLEICRKQAETHGGTFGTNRYVVTGPVEANFGMTCMRSNSVGLIGLVDVPPHAVLAAPVQLAAGWGGINVKPETRFLWCDFSYAQGQVKLVSSGIGISGNKSTIESCGLSSIKNGF